MSKRLNLDYEADSPFFRVIDNWFESIPPRYPHLAAVGAAHVRAILGAPEKVELYSYIGVLDVFAYLPIGPVYDGSYHMRRYWKKVKET